MRTLITLIACACVALSQPADSSLEMVSFPPLGALSNTTYCIMDASGERAGGVIYAPKSGDITHVIFSTTTVTTAETLRVGIYTVDSSGNPTTTAAGGMTVGTQASPAANTQYRVALGTAATVTKGDIIAPVVDFDSSVGNLRINYYGAYPGSPGKSGNVPPAGKCYTGSWATQPAPAIIIEYSDGSLYSGVNAIPIASSATASGNFNSGTASTPHRGNKITMQYPMLATEVCFKTGTWAANSSAIFRITDTSRNTLASTPAVPVGMTVADFVACAPLTTSLAMSKGVSYYVFAIPQTTDNINIADSTRISGAETYNSMANYVARIQGDQSVSFTEASTHHYVLLVQGVRLPSAGGFTVTQ